MIERRILPVLFACTVLCSAFALPQAETQPATGAQQPPPTYRVRSGLVVVDVTVRDRSGQAVKDLKKEDFTVYEDNVAQKTVTFSLEDIPVSAPETIAGGAETAPRSPPVNFSRTPPSESRKEELRDKRLIILFFDLSSLTTEDLIRSVGTAQEFVARRSTSHDLIAVATYSSTLQLLQDLTNDGEVLLDTLKKINPTEAGDAATGDLGDVSTSDEEFIPDDVQFNIFNTDRRLSAIETLAKGYSEYPERKSLIYFSSGMTTTGIENQSQIRSTVDVANQSNMSIYTVDSRGLDALPPGGGAARGGARGRAMFTGDAMTRQTAGLSSSQETLTTLSYDTGGTSFQDSNALDPVFDKVLSDTQSYYILGYYSSNTKEDGRFRKIRVEVARPGLGLQHRPGYFATKQFTRLTRTERERLLEEAFNVDRPFSDLPFILQAGYFRNDAGSCLVPLSLQFAGDGVDFEEKGNRREAQLEFLAQIRDPKGNIAGVARDIVQVRLPVQTAEKIRSGRILYSTGFQLRPGDYTLKFLVRDNHTGKMGTFEQPLEVPRLDAASLQVSSVVLGSRLVDRKESSRGVEHREFGDRFRSLGARQDPLVIEDQKLVPSIANVFLKSQTLYVYFQVYGAAADRRTGKPELETLLTFIENKAKVLESKPQLVREWARDSKGTAAVAMAVPLRALKRGAYTLQVHVRDNVADANLFRRVPFVIR